MLTLPTNAYFPYFLNFIPIFRVHIGCKISIRPRRHFLEPIINSSATGKTSGAVMDLFLRM